MDFVVYDDDEHRYVPWAVALGALALVAVLAAGAAFFVGRQSSESAALSGGAAPQAATAPTPAEEPLDVPSPSEEPVAPTSAPPTSAAPTSAPPTSAPPTSAPPVSPDPLTSSAAADPVSSPACTQALLQADAALERSVAIERALAEQTRVMDELLAQRVSTEQALDEVLPVLTDAATERRRFREQVVQFEGTREDCPL